MWYHINVLPLKACCTSAASHFGFVTKRVESITMFTLRVGSVTITVVPRNSVKRAGISGTLVLCSWEQSAFSFAELIGI